MTDRAAEPGFPGLSQDSSRRAHQGIAGVVGDPSGDLAGGTCAGN